ncbi:MAG TPA: MBL fold metallo-hydrolase [Myxococcota bacterium]|nr:MBL fold metallo-hydrolase [Myxococcota bacterium]
MSELVFVGTSDAFGAAGRRQSAMLLRAPNGAVLLDCGTTTCTGLSALGIPRSEIDVILVSHFHADHFGGIPTFLLAASYEDRRRRLLRIAGPRGVESRVRAAAAALGHSFEDRHFPFPISFQELPAGPDHEIGPIRVRSFETKHQADSSPHGLSLQVGPKRMAFSGDTGWFEGLPAQVRGADLFVCECTLLTPQFEYHLSLEELTRERGAFDCGRMILTHLGESMASRRGSCDFETADDGLVVKL